MTHNSSTATFAALGLSPQALAALERIGFERPTPIQAGAIPAALQGKDVIGCAATGTGKSAAFSLPMLDRLATRPAGSRGLVLAPTRELALQIAAVIEQLGHARGLHCATIIGGLPMPSQVKALRQKPAVIVATPGRLVDHLNQGTADLSNVEVLVLDEADRMLDMGFRPQLTRVLAKVPRARQTLLFSATLGEDVKDFARVANLREPVRVEISRSGTTAARADQGVYLVGQNEKLPLLLSLLAQSEESTLVFTRTKRRADKVARIVERAGHSVARIHADRSQAQRRHALEGFRKGTFRVLIATDIAARGLDVEEIAHVINFDLPHLSEDYVHRIGRTARAGASGTASSFAAPEELELLTQIERFTRSALPRREVDRSTPAFIAELQRSQAAQANPGPRQAGHGVSTRPPGAQPGRHARTHARRPKQGAPPKRATSTQHTPSSGSWKPKRRH